MQWKRTRTRDNNREPWWVTALTDGGRPLVTVIVLVLCAPGEHQLGVMAGWNSHLAWGIAALFAAYAGIAAVIAARRKGKPGARAANIGSLTALALAMASQPVAHLYARGVWQPDPHDTVWLIVAVSCVPAPVLAHLLHLAATPNTRTDTPVTTPDQADDQSVYSDETHMTTPEQPGQTTPTSLDDHRALTLTDGLLTTQQVMDMIGKSRVTLGRYNRDGKLVPVRTGPNGVNYYHPDHVAAFTA